MQYLTISVLSKSDWSSADFWNTYLGNLQLILSDKLSKLDNRDPVKRASNSVITDGEFISKANKSDNRNWIYGKFKKSRIEIQINWSVNPVDEYGRSKYNYLEIYIPMKLPNDLSYLKITELFKYTNLHLQGFYGYGGLSENFRNIKDNSRRLDFDRELPGIFWLTYFNKQYVDFFKLKEKLDGYKFEENDAGGITVILSHSPIELEEQDCRKLEEHICSRSFFRNSEFNQIGEYVIPLENIK